jgi:succinate dehydrogenase / fumarate reductase membrane anchor subunit
MSLRNPLAKARGLGSAKDGVGHWTAQRLSAIALALLAPFFVWTVLSVGGDAAAARAAIGSPITAALLVAFVVALFWHAQLGLQVVIEDYVHHRGLEIALQVAVRFACALGAIVAVLSIGRLVFTA